MKNTILALIFILRSLISFSQAPNLINYQGLIRDGSGNVISSQQIGLKFTITRNGLTPFILKNIQLSPINTALRIY